MGTERLGWGGGVHQVLLPFLLRSSQLCCLIIRTGALTTQTSRVLPGPCEITTCKITSYE